MNITRRTLLQTLAAYAAYCLTYTGIVKPKLDCVRRIKCGDLQKLLVIGGGWPVLAMKYQGTFNASFGELGDMFCETFSFQRDASGRWRGAVTYREGKSPFAVVVDMRTGKQNLSECSTMRTQISYDWET